MTSKVFETNIRVRYAETDRMGYCYYGNFAAYFEVGRVEALRELGVAYKNLEDEGVLLPVRDFQIRYFKPAYYDELLTIQTRIDKVSGARMYFSYTTLNASGEKLNIASTTLVFVDSASEKPINPPKEIFEILNSIANIE